jgi:hypothetical protein
MAKAILENTDPAFGQNSSPHPFFWLVKKFILGENFDALIG